MAKAVHVAENEANKVESSKALQHSYGRRRGGFQIFRFRTQSSYDPSNFAGGLTLRWSFHDIIKFKKISHVADISQSEVLHAEDE